jgi:hypothetical protein
LGGAEYLYVMGARSRAYAVSLSTAANWLKTHGAVVNIKNVKFVSMSNVRIAGLPGRRVVQRAVDGGVWIYVVNYVVIKAGWAYTLSVIDQAAHEKADDSFAGQLIGTFRFA